MPPGCSISPRQARFPRLLQLPEGAELGKAVNDAMRAVEKENPDLADVLPKTFQILENRTLAELLKVMASIPMDKEGEDLSDEDFKEQLTALNEELEVLNAEARELEEKIAGNVTEILETA